MPWFSKGAGKDREWHFMGRPFGLVIIVLYKLVWGTMEFVGGVLFLLSFRVIAAELFEDPQGELVGWLSAHVFASDAAARNVGLVVAGMGLLNLVEGGIIWFRSRTVRIVALWFFGIIGLFGIYSLTAKFGVMKSFAVLGDVAIFLYIWKVLPEHLVDEGVK